MNDMTNRKTKGRGRIRQVLCLIMAIVLCLSLMPTALATGTGNDNVNYSAVCKVTRDSEKAGDYVYKTGEGIVFGISARYATPNNTNPSAPAMPTSVTFNIPIPTLTPAIQLPMFNEIGKAEGYVGVPMYSVINEKTNETIRLYLMTGASGERWIEFSLAAGSSVNCAINLIVPNGISNDATVRLDPVIVNPDKYGDNTLLEGAEAKVEAEFGWNPVSKTGSVTSIGIIGGSSKDPDRIEYTIAADSKSSGKDKGAIFTKYYTLNDTLQLSGLNYADGELTQSNTDGISTFSIGGTPVLDIVAPLDALTVTKTVSGGMITGFNMIYRVENSTLSNVNVTPVELPNLNLKVTLLLGAMQVSEGTDETKVTNTAQFDAYSPFWDETASDEVKAEQHSSSSSSHTAYASDRYTMTKTAYTDEGCTTPATIVGDKDYLWYKITVENNGASSDNFKIVDKLPIGLVYQSDTSGKIPTQDGQTLTWEGVSIASRATYSIIVKTQVDLSSPDLAENLHNVVGLFVDNHQLTEAKNDTKYLTGEDTTAGLEYEKTVDKTTVKIGDTITYTIKATNTDKTQAKLVTIVDKWPGNNVRPTKVTGCEIVKYLDKDLKEYTLEEIAASSSIIISEIKFYNVSVPAGGSATVTVEGIVINTGNKIVNTIKDTDAEAVSYGVGIDKTAYAYDLSTNTLGAALTKYSRVNAGDTVCYIMSVENKLNTAATVNKLVDKLPVGLSLQQVSFNGATGSIILKRGDKFEALKVEDSDKTTNYQTTASFELAPGEKVGVYLFAKVSSEAILNSATTNSTITNRAYVVFNDVQTGDASANIYTSITASDVLTIDKYFKFVADFNDNLEYTGTWLRNSDNGAINAGDYSPTATVWNGAYVGYQVKIKNPSNFARDPIKVYEVIDSLPAGMEFVGVASNGKIDAFDNLTGKGLNLTDELIMDGKSGEWSSGTYESNILVNYDPATRKVSIAFTNAASSLPVTAVGLDETDDKYSAFFLIVARVTDDKDIYSYKNIVEAKVDTTVTPGSDENSFRTDGFNNYISDDCTCSRPHMKPGIIKTLLGHYYPGAETLDSGSSINPGESLRFQIQVMNQGLSDGDKDIYASMKNFVITDYLPAEFIYQEDSATVTLNVPFDTSTGADKSGSSLTTIKPFDTKVEALEGGGTKLTWTFGGFDMRLLNNTLKSGIGYKHIISYDVDWNTAVEKRYGSFENVAVLSCTDKFSEVSSGLPDYEKNTVTANTLVSIYGAIGTTSIEAVENRKLDTTNSKTSEKTITVQGAGDRVRYTMEVSNSSSTVKTNQINNVIIINELSRAEGDTGVVNRIDRGSQFSVFLDADPDVQITTKNKDIEKTVPSDKYTVYYGTSTGALNANGDWASGNGSGGNVSWGTESNGKNALRIVFDPGYVFESGDTIYVDFYAVAGEDATPGETAWNSFGYAYKSLLESREVSDKVYAEPVKVGITVDGAKITIKKLVEGDAPSDTVFSFILKQNGTVLKDVEYTVGGSDKTNKTTEEGIFQLKAGETATIYVGSGEGYTVEETNIPANYNLKAINVVNSGDGTTSNNVFTFKKLESSSEAGVVFSNNYTVPAKRDVTVTKVWAGQTDPKQPTSINVQLYKSGTPDGEPITLSKDNSWTHTWTELETKYTWTVKEVTALSSDYTVTYSGDSKDGFTITNTYKDPTTSVSVTKVWAGTVNPTQPTSVNVQLYCDKVKYGTEQTLSQSNSWKYTWEKLEPNHTWEVMETTELGTSYMTNIKADGTNNFVITNTYIPPTPTTVNVKAQKVWRGDIDPNRPVSVNINLLKDGKVIDTKIADATNNWSCFWSNLEPGNWTVAEATTLTKGYTTTVSGNILDGFIVTNTYSAQYGELSLSKTVTGSLGSKTKDWTFRVTFSDGGTYAYTGSKSGTLISGGTVTLKHNQSITFANIPAGTTYAISERESNTDGYTTTSKEASGTIVANKKAEASFTNYKSTNPKTGDSADFLLWGGAMLLSASLLSAAFVLLRKKGRKTTK